jgi:hypothetical protein
MLAEVRMAGEPRPSVEFLDELPPEPTSVPSAQRRLTLVLCALVAVVVLAVVVDVASRGTHHARPSRTVAGPSATPSTGPGVRAVADTPSAGVTQAFTADVPGSMPVFESTSTQRLAGGTVVVSRRTVQAVSGNVEITVSIVRSPGQSAAPRAHVTRLAHAGYVFDFRFSGFYPPSAAELRRLSADSRLTSARS